MRQIDNSFNTFLKAFGLDNYEYFGGGNFSRVYKTNRGTVIKFTVDDFYIDFVRSFVGKGNSLAPEIITDFGVVGKLLERDYDGMKDYNKLVNIYALELPIYNELFEFGDWGSKTDLPLHNKLAEIVGNIDSMSRYEIIQENELFEESLSGYVNHLDRLHKLGVDLMDAVDMTAKIRRLIESDNSFIDFDMGNAMLSNDGRLIVNDPVASRNTVCSLDDSSHVYDLDDVFETIDLTVATEITKLLGKQHSKDFVDFMAKVHYNAVNENIGV